MSKNRRKKTFSKSEKFMTGQKFSHPLSFLEITNFKQKNFFLGSEPLTLFAAGLKLKITESVRGSTPFPFKHLKPIFFAFG